MGFFEKTVFSRENEARTTTHAQSHVAHLDYQRVQRTVSNNTYFVSTIRLLCLSGSTRCLFVAIPNAMLGCTAARQSWGGPLFHILGRAFRRVFDQHRRCALRDRG